MNHRYPRRLLPNHKCFIIPENAFRSDFQDFFLLRRVRHDDSYPDIRDRLKSQFKPSTFKNGISVVLYSFFRKEDIGWCCRKPYGKKMKYECVWEKNNQKTVFPKNKHLQYEKSATFEGYRISDVYEYQADYPFPVKDNGKLRDRADEVRLKVVHEPVSINFWHCEIMLYGMNGDDHTEYVFSNKQAERAGNIILDDLADMAYSCDKAHPMSLKRNYYKHKIKSFMRKSKRRATVRALQ